MHPVLLQVGRFRLFSYGFLIALGGAVTVRFWLSRRARMGFSKDEQLWLLVNAILLSGFAGGRLLFVFEYTRPFSAAFWRSLVGINEGFSVLGAFASVTLGVYVACRLAQAPFLRVLDYVCAGAPLWHVFGRLGCFMAGCCYGLPTKLPWGVTFTDPRSMVEPALLGRPLHPTQLYEAAGDLAIFALLYRLALPRLESGRLARGSAAALYFASYAALRFFLEFLRADAVPTRFFGLTAGQGLCLLLGGGAAAAVWARRPPTCIPS